MIIYFLKLKFYLGFKNALRVYIDKVILKRDLKISFLKHKFFINHNNFADNQTFNEVVLKGSYKNLIKEKATVKRIIDLGSNIGLSIISFLNEYPNTEIVAVEPERNNLKILKDNIEPYIKDGRKIRLYESPVYSKEMNLNLQDANRGSNGFIVSEMETDNNIEWIKSITINQILNDLKWETVDLIKIDIEGAEFELLQENIEWISKTKCLIIETHDRFKPNCTRQLFKTLEPFKYSVKNINENFLIIFD